MPVRMLNEYTYCPRLMYLEWVDGEWADSADTVEGRFVHRRVDEPGGRLPAELPEGERIHSRSVELSDLAHALIARMDLVESDSGAVVPIDYKRGEPPDTPERAWEPERVQLCAQGLILRSQGYRCERGMLYYTAAHLRVEVPLDDALVQRTLDLIDQLKAAARQALPPPPLADSPKCARCSLVGICLPGETAMLSRPPESPRI